MVELIDFLPLLLAWILDLCLGDPVRLPHPVVAFGKLISNGEHALNRGTYRKLKGVLLDMVLVVGTYTLTAFMLGCLPTVIGFLVNTLLRFYCLAGTTSIREVK